MYSITPARLRGRTRRALLALALPAALVAAALPSAAEAATASIGNAGPTVLTYDAAPGETNQVFIRVVGSKLVISDSAPITARDGCTLNGNGDAECPFAISFATVQLGDRNDSLQYAAPHKGFVVGQAGADTFFGGIRQVGQGRAVEPVFYRGDAGSDTIDYVAADRGVHVHTDDNPNLQDSLATDGRAGIDRENVAPDVEHIQGSNFDDTLIGSNASNLFLGRNGDDVIAGRGGDDFIDEGSAPNGADTIGGDSGAGDRVSYGTRTTGGVNVSLDSVRNDGAPGEQDNVGGSVEHVWGTNFRDVLTGNGQANVLEGFGGPDTIAGLAGNDTLFVGAGNNGVSGGTGNDVIGTVNGAIDDIDCGENANDSDTANRDTTENRVVGCERGTVGILELAPKTVNAEAAKTARLALGWRHPRAWRKLRKVELRLLSQNGTPLGEVTIGPRDGRIGADGAVKLVRKHSRLARKGKTVSARLALRLDESLAGQTLDVEVEATDRGGRRQLERNAGSIRVAG